MSDLERAFGETAGLKNQDARHFPPAIAKLSTEAEGCQLIDLLPTRDALVDGLAPCESFLRPVPVGYGFLSQLPT